MELPFYLTFKEFESHYYDTLEQWFEEYHNASEIDFLKALADLYGPYLYYSFADDRLLADASMEIKDCFSHTMKRLEFPSVQVVTTENILKPPKE